MRPDDYSPSEHITYSEGLSLPAGGGFVQNVLNIGSKIATSSATKVAQKTAKKIAEKAFDKRTQEVGNKIGQEAVQRVSKAFNPQGDKIVQSLKMTSTTKNSPDGPTNSKAISERFNKLL